MDCCEPFSPVLEDTLFFGVERFAGLGMLLVVYDGARLLRGWLEERRFDKLTSISFLNGGIDWRDDDDRSLSESDDMQMTSWDERGGRKFARLTGGIENNPVGEVMSSLDSLDIGEANEVDGDDDSIRDGSGGVGVNIARSPSVVC